MKKMYKAMLLVLCAVLLVAGSVMGTLAYLQAQTGTIKNTMTVGNVSITLDEAKTDAYGVKQGETRIPATADPTTGNSYKLVPGREYTKDPKITVADGSEDCWVFIKVENGLNPDVTFDIDTANWVIISTTTSTTTNVTVYGHNSTLSAKQSATLFTKFTFSEDADPSTYATASIQVTGYAVQAYGFDTALAAWQGANFQ